jgi:hypothetical protein
VFIHGLGLGLAQYHVTLSHLFQTFNDRPILVPLQPHISQDIFHSRFLMPPSKKEMANNLSDMLLRLGWVDKRDDSVSGHGVTMLSHSNGSYSHAWMLKTHPKMVTRSCFVDPVTFCSWEGGNRSCMHLPRVILIRFSHRCMLQLFVSTMHNRKFIMTLEETLSC